MTTKHHAYLGLLGIAVATLGCGPAHPAAESSGSAATAAGTAEPGQESGQPTIAVTALNDYLLFFFDGRDPSTGPAQDNWVADAAMKLGIGTYAIHQGDQAIVYDTFTSLAQARWVRDYLTEQGVKRFTVVQSHWHLDHIAGNQIYSDSEIVSSLLTKQLLEEKKADIEAGKVWGPPAITPLVVPTTTYEGQRTLRVGDIEVELRNLNIHSKDTTVLYLPRDKILLAGDTLEDPLTYMVEIDQLHNHVAGLRTLLEMDIAAIYPNHGDPAVITGGGYDKQLIRATIAYITAMLTHAHDPDYLKGTMEDYIGESLAKGWVHAFEPYRAVHEMNLGLVHEYYKDKPLPTLPE